MNDYAGVCDDSDNKNHGSELIMYGRIARVGEEVIENWMMNDDYFRM